MVTTALRERMRQLMRVRNYSPRTEETYIDAIMRFARHFGRSPAELGKGEIHQYQIWLREERGVSATAFNQTAAALRFLYMNVLARPDEVEGLLHARRERRLPVVLSTGELRRFLGEISDVRYKTLLCTIYSGGLRVSEALRLRIDDIDSARMVIRIRQGKGKKDRYVPLSPMLLEMLRAWWREARPRTWLFGSQSDPDRPMDPATLQKYVQTLVRRGGWKKRITPRTLRHSFATHLIEGGTSPRVVQVLLGHANVRTTETYMHVSPQTLRDATSPLDRLLKITD